MTSVLSVGQPSAILPECNRFLRFTSGATSANLLTASIPTEYYLIDVLAHVYKHWWNNNTGSTGMILAFSHPGLNNLKVENKAVVFAAFRCGVCRTRNDILFPTTCLIGQFMWIKKNEFLLTEFLYNSKREID